MSRKKWGRQIILLARGNEHRGIFYDENDRHLPLNTIGETAESWLHAQGKLCCLSLTFIVTCFEKAFCLAKGKSNNIPFPTKAPKRYRV